jgi:hypothetical protein
MRAVAAVVLSLVALLLLFSSRIPQRQALALRRAMPEIDAHVTMPAPAAARLLSLGHNELLADLTWIRTLVYYGDGLAQNHGMPDVEKLILLMNRLDPWFRRPYFWGAHATTYRRQEATQEEFRASADILRRAVARFPADYEMAWLLGLRLYFDLRSPDPQEQARLREEGAMYIERAMRLPGAPSDLPVLAATLRTRLGQKERALRELREMILTTEDERARETLEAKYAALANDASSSEIGSAAKKLEAEWKANLPYVPPSLYILLGPPPPPAIDLAAVARGERFDTLQVDSSQP